MRLFCALGVMIASMAMASEYSEGWGPPTGTRIPDEEFTSHLGETRTFADLMGEKGVLILFNRSANW
ncbi:MAG: hypothetical protein OXT64_01120 [Gammaproteobacteria bacterium]|nr:hypothetical protein [Gammaproteobacteria bacterium]